MASDDFITIYRPDVFSRFRGGSIDEAVDASQWFATCLADQYIAIAKSHDCEAYLSATHTEEARLLWVRDSGRIDIDGDTIPDHFKQAGFLAYWLRRRFVLAHCRRIERIEPSERQDKFMLRANEICAFLFGFRLSLYFELKDVIDSQDHIGHELEAIYLEDHLKFDIATLMKHKNVSPHSLYLIYRTLFYDLKKPKRNAKIISLPKR